MLATKKNRNLNGSIPRSEESNPHSNELVVKYLWLVFFVKQIPVNTTKLPIKELSVRLIKFIIIKVRLL
jgi:hypothetical protein